jgi:dienelactone hydrolase
VRPFEWLLVGLLAARLLAILLRGESGMLWRLLTAVGVGGALVAHLAWEGPRWTMAPSYVLATVVVLLIAWERPHPKAVMLKMGRNRRLRRPVPWGRATLALVLWAPTVALSVLLPVWTPPAPTGAWAVGSRSFALALPDALGADGQVERGRRTMARMWYPVDPARALPNDAPWVERGGGLLRSMARSAGLPDFVFSHLRLVRTHAAWFAPLAPPSEPSGWPVVTFDHGLGGFRSQNTYLAEELASHGAVVVALDHPGDALGTTLPDGTVIPYVGLPHAAAPGYAAAVVALGERWQADTSALLQFLADLAPVGDLADFAGALDLQRVVASGHSTGGGVAVEVCQAWAGCRATLSLDPWWAPVHPTRLASGTDKPVLAIASDPQLAYFPPSNDDRFARFAAASPAQVRLLVLEGGGHHDFDDLALLSPLAARFGHHVGPVAKESAMAVVRRVAVALLAGDAPDDLAAAAPAPLWATPAPRLPLPAPPTPRLPPPGP